MLYTSWFNMNSLVKYRLCPKLKFYGCGTVWSFGQLPTFWRFILPPSSGLKHMVLNGPQLWRIGPTAYNYVLIGCLSQYHTSNLSAQRMLLRASLQCSFLPNTYGSQWMLAEPSVTTFCIFRPCTRPASGMPCAYIVSPVSVFSLLHFSVYAFRELS